MNVWANRSTRWVALLAIASAATALRAETFTLPIKRVDPVSPRSSPRPADYMFQYTSPQHFYMQIGVAGEMPRDSNVPAFADVVKKEPAAYKSKHPFRGVAQLGGQHFGFVLDTSREAKPPEAKPAKAKGPAQQDAGGKGPAPGPPAQPASAAPEHYDRLYFDVNHNGDLTDDRVIEAEADGARYPASYARYTFPRVDLTLDAAGTNVEYAFRFSVYSSGSAQYQYASASLNAAAYRDGEITLEGKQRRIILIDFNSNGRFDDQFAIDHSITTGDGSAYPKTGDMIYVDPRLDQAGYRYGYDVTASDEQHYVGKLIPIDGRFYELSVSPAGDRLTLTRSSVGVGFVSNPNQGYRAVVYGSGGLLKVCGSQTGRAALPEGEWKLLAYTIDRTLLDQPEKSGDKAPSLLQSLSATLLQREASTGPRMTVISARAKGDYLAVKVVKGETAELRFGPPYKPVVQVGYRQPDGQVSLGMSLVGSAGELCSNLMVDGDRPAKPEFTILGPDDKEVERGTFEFG